MPTSPRITWQPSLLDSASEPDLDESFSAHSRVRLDARAWVDYVPGWVSGSDLLFAELLENTDWDQRSRHMYERKLQEPRLTSLWRASSGDDLPRLIEEMRILLSARYEVEFDSVGFNLYRDGRDSVAWHGDHISEAIVDPVVALVSVGEPRKFLLRPKGGGTSTRFLLGRGDLLVTGGSCQRTWEHSVPKVAEAGPRISIAFRHGLKVRTYES